MLEVRTELRAYPVIDLPMLPRAVGVRDLVVLVISVHKVLHDGGTLKKPNGLAIFKGVRQGGDAAIGVDLQEPRLLLRVLAKFNVCSLRARLVYEF